MYIYMLCDRELAPSPEPILHLDRLIGFELGGASFELGGATQKLVGQDLPEQLTALFEADVATMHPRICPIAVPFETAPSTQET